MSTRADNGCTKRWGGIADLVDCGCVLVADRLSKCYLGDGALDLSLSKLNCDLRVTWQMSFFDRMSIRPEERIAPIV